MIKAETIIAAAVLIKLSRDIESTPYFRNPENCQERRTAFPPAGTQRGCVCRRPAFLIHQESFLPQSESGGKDVIRRLKSDALRLGDRCWQRPEERGTAVIDFPTQQHGVVFVHRVMAVLHEHAAKVAELHGQCHAAAWTQTIYVLPSLLPSRNITGASVSSEDLAFFKVDVNGMVPSASTVLQSPDFARAETRRRGNASVIGVSSEALVVRLDSPRA